MTEIKQAMHDAQPRRQSDDRARLAHPAREGRAIARRAVLGRWRGGGGRGDDGR
jgi:hypothetical protein